MTEQPFWKTKTLAEMSNAEWESLCDGCGLCCLNKLEDWDTGEVVFTSVACRLLDTTTARCRDYRNRKAFVPDCLRLTPKLVSEVAWLPKTCAYKLRAKGRPLPEWHYLISGDPASVVRAGVSISGRVVSETLAGRFSAYRTRSDGDSALAVWTNTLPAGSQT